MRLRLQVFGFLTLLATLLALGLMRNRVHQPWISCAGAVGVFAVMVVTGAERSASGPSTILLATLVAIVMLGIGLMVGERKRD